jgi:hypothetical protein
MKNQVIKINKTVYDNRGNEYSEVITPVIHRIKPKEEMRQRGVHMDSLQAILYGSEFVVQVQAFAKIEELQTPYMSFPVFVQKGMPQSSVREVTVVIPNDVEFSETNLSAATMVAFEEKFGKGNVELVEL